MCLAIGQKKGAETLSSDIISISYKNNSDGSGIAFVDETNNIQVRKFRELDTFVDQYTKLHYKYGKDSPFLIHSRIGTHGTNDGILNVHPFWVNKNLVFCHNGIINKVRNDNKLSDTQVFNKDFLQALPKNLWISNPAIINLLADYIGNSKLVFISSDRKLKIINHKMGHWKNNTWFSNSSYKSNVFDFGGNSVCNIKQTTFPFNDKKEKYNPIGYKERIQVHSFESCGNCGLKSSKQKTNTDLLDWVCTTCYNELEGFI